MCAECNRTTWLKIVKFFKHIITYYMPMVKLMDYEFLFNKLICKSLVKLNRQKKCNLNVAGQQVISDKFQ